MNASLPIKRVEDFGFILRTEREDRGITQVQLAERADVSVRWLSNFEGGKSPRAELYKVLAVARAMNLVFHADVEQKPTLAVTEQALTDLMLDRYSAGEGEQNG